MFENGTGWESDDEKLEDNLDALYLGATTRHQWQVLVTTLAASKKEHAEKTAQDKRDKELSKDTKKNRKLMKMKRNQQQNLVCLFLIRLFSPPILSSLVNLIAGLTLNVSWYGNDFCGALEQLCFFAFFWWTRGWTRGWTL